MEFTAAKKFILKKLKKELPPHLSYHSVDHIRDVYDACKWLAREEGVRGEDLKLLLTAALFHDAGFLINQKEHERLSCDIVRQYLPQFCFSELQIEKICGMIMATRIPQEPLNKLEEILADADLDYLGRDDFFIIGNRLFDELCVYGLLSSEEEWNRLQIKFLEHHHFFTETAIKFRKPKKDEHLNIVRSKINRLT